jgi:hypothetical protein
MWPETDKVKENQSARNLQGKRGVELLIDRAQSTRKGKWEIKVAKREANKQKFRIKYPLRAPRKDVRILG